MLDVFEYLKDRWQGKTEAGKKRSSKWASVRSKFLKKNPACVVCGSTSNLTVHHIIPFHLAPELELEEKNLATLCENMKFGLNCHLLIGHLGSFKKWNPNFGTDSVIWNKKLKG